MRAYGENNAGDARYKTQHDDEAVQKAGEEDVVYVVAGEKYTQRVVRLGKRDARRVEVLSGLKPGEVVVTEQSFLIKADIEKSTAEHDH